MTDNRNVLRIDASARKAASSSRALTDALIEISTNPSKQRERREEIRVTLQETLRKKGVVPLTRGNFVKELGRGGLKGLHARGQAVMHLGSNTQQLGLVVRGETSSRI